MGGAERKEAVSKKRAQPPLVLAIDIGSSATRGRVYDARGLPLKKLEARVRHQFEIRGDGTVVTDAERLCGDVERVIDALVDGAGKHGEAIAAVAMDTFAATVVGVDAAGKPVTPVYTYADTRPTAAAEALRQRIDEDAMQQRTGTRFHPAYLPARLLWLQESDPETFARVSAWMSLGEFIYARFLGARAISYSSAAWAGILNRRTLDYDDELLAALPLKREQLAPLYDATQVLRGLTRAYAHRWPALHDAAWFPAIADGFAGNVGCDAQEPRVGALAIGSSAALRALLPEQPASVPRGLWCYTVDRRRALLGGALNDGGRALEWLEGVLALPRSADLDAVATTPPRDDTPLVLPFLTGERNPGYALHATGAIGGLRWQTGAEDIARGLLEGVAFRLAAIADELRGVVPELAMLIASGGGVDRVPGWCRILADAIGLPVAASGEDQATLRGTALLALEAIAPDVQRVEAAVGATTLPEAAHAAVYATKRRAHDAFYAALVDPAPAAT